MTADRPFRGLTEDERYNLPRGACIRWRDSDFKGGWLPERTGVVTSQLCYDGVHLNVMESFGGSVLVQETAFVERVAQTAESELYDRLCGEKP